MGRNRVLNTNSETLETGKINSNMAQIKHRSKRNLVYFGDKGCSQELDVLKTLHNDGNATKANETINSAVRIDKTLFLAYFAHKYPHLISSNLTTPRKDFIEFLRNELIANSSVLIRKNQEFKRPDPNKLKIVYKEKNSSKIKIDTYTRRRRHVVEAKQLDKDTDNEQRYANMATSTKTEWQDNVNKKLEKDDLNEFMDKMKESQTKDSKPFNSFLKDFKIMKENENVDKIQKENYDKFVKDLKDMKYKEMKYGTERVTARKKASDEHVLADVKYNLERAMAFREKDLGAKEKTTKTPRRVKRSIKIKEDVRDIKRIQNKLSDRPKESGLVRKKRFLLNKKKNLTWYKYFKEKHYNSVENMMQKAYERERNRKQRTGKV